VLKSVLCTSCRWPEY